jgi:hypothetical protein
MLLARCFFLFRFDGLLSRSPLPFGTFTSLQIKAFCRIRRQSTRLPITPDSLSLPAADSIAKFGFGSPFQSRYVSGGLLFLKPLGTFSTMILKSLPVNTIYGRNVPFPQSLFSLFRISYSARL